MTIAITILSKRSLAGIAAGTGLLFAVGCSVPSGGKTVTISHNAIVAGTASSDYATGNVGLFDLTTGATAKNCATIFSDNFITSYNGAVYVLEREGKDNLIRFADHQIGAGAILYQKHLGQNLNLADIAFAGPSKAYVACNLGKNVLVVDPATGAVLDSIDLSRFDAFAGTSNDPGIPYMQALALYNGKLYVACERLKPDSSNIPQPVDTSKVAIVSVSGDSIVGSISLSKRNPYSMAVVGSKLYIVSTGAWGDPTDGGIECVDLTTDRNTGLVVGETPFGGDISSICVVSDQKAYVAVAKNSLDFTTFWTDLVEFNPSTGAVGTKVSGVDNAFGGAAFDGTHLFVGDRSKTAPGIVEIDPATNLKVGGPYDVGLPPGSLTYFQVN